MPTSRFDALLFKNAIYLFSSYLILLTLTAYPAHQFNRYAALGLLKSLFLLACRKECTDLISPHNNSKLSNTVLAVK